MAGASRGRVVVVSGPSGAGKSTVVRRLLARAPVPLVRSVSATTRPPRPGEVNGVDYHFLSPAEFERLRQEGAFIECFAVFGGSHWYGTLRDEVEPRREAGQWVLLEIDVHGAEAVCREYPDAVTIFVHAGSPEELERRLRGRETEDEEAIQARLAQAQAEMAVGQRYRFQIENSDVDRAVEEISEILIGLMHEPS